MVSLVWRWWGGRFARASRIVASILLDTLLVFGEFPFKGLGWLDDSRGGSRGRGTGAGCGFILVGHFRPRFLEQTVQSTRTAEFDRSAIKATASA